MLSPQAAGRLNQSKTLGLAVGMTKAEAVAVMGTTPYEVATGPVARESIPNPYTSETFTGAGGSQIEVLYYAASEGSRIPMQALRLQLLPLVFRSGRLVGWGDDALDSVKLAGAARTSSR
jgi:hypothetical protein